MSRSTRGACRVGALCILWLLGGATALAAEEPLFSRCGPPGPAENDRMASRMTREGRSALAPVGAAKLIETTILPALLAFGLRPDGWPTSSPTASVDRSKLFCPPAARL